MANRESPVGIGYGFVTASPADRLRALADPEAMTAAAALARAIGGTLTAQLLLPASTKRTPSPRPTPFEHGLGPGVKLDSEAIQDKLHAPIGELPISHMVAHMCTRAYDGLGGLVDTVGGAWCLGESGLYSIPRFGPESRDLVTAAMRRHLPELPIVDVMYPEDIAQICFNLDQVPVAAISRIYGPMLWGHRLTVHDVIRDEDPRIIDWEEVEHFVSGFAAERIRRLTTEHNEASG